MFIGHFGAGFAAKKIDERPSLGTMFFASQFIDLLWPVFLFTGIERVQIDSGNTAFTPLNFIYYPFSHSLISVLFWSVLFGSVYYLLKRNLKSSIILGGLVASHWVLDLITHRPDLPLSPWQNFKMGLGLWNSVLLTMLLEGSIFIFGAFLYMKTTRALNIKGTFGLWGLVLFLSLIYVLNAFGPPPPSEKPIAILGLSIWLLVAWGYWIDRHRELRTNG
ncbi:MAG: hypothetical protein JXB48_00345 [Candidatus Latescibacteria bacterium]|nr:hypothetical protein [Candidatus Latescibacterota bacterium]